MSRPSVNDNMDYEPPEEVWFPKVGEPARVACDWTIKMGEVGTVVKMEAYEDPDAFGASVTVRFEDGSEDVFDSDELRDPAPHRCEHDDCASMDTQEYAYPPYEQQGKTMIDTEWLCAEHAALCFCLNCGNFCAGIESFDFSPIKGICDNCIGEFDDDEEWEDDYDDFSYGTGYDIIEGEEYGVDISPDNDTMGKTE